MNFINSNFSTSIFRHFAAAISVSGGKTVAGNEGRGEGSAVSIIRDKLTLSPEGRSAYTAYTNKLNKTEQSAPTTETQDESAESFVSSDVSDAGNKSFNDVVSEVLAVNQNVENVQANFEPPLTIAQTIAPVSESAAGVRGTTDAEGNTLVSIREESNGYFSSFADIRRWERDNNFFFNTIEGAPPLTPEEKKHYNEMLTKALSEGIHPLHGYKTSLNRVEGTDWLIADGAEALIGHEVLGMLEGMLAKSGGRVNEYGFYIDMPGSHNGMIFLTSEIVQPDLYFWTGQYKETADGWTIVEGTGTWQKSESSGMTTKVPVPAFMPDGSFAQTFTPEISFRDATGLGGMSLTDRKQFLASAQKIIDRVMPGLNVDARSFTYSTAYLSNKDFENGKLSLTISNNIGGMLSDDQRDTLQHALNENRQLVEMKHRADQSNNKGLGEFTMSVLDANGNALAKDQVRLIAGNKSVTTTIDTIKDMDHQQIFALINR